LTAHFRCIQHTRQVLIALRGVNKHWHCRVLAHSPGAEGEAGGDDGGQAFGDSGYRQRHRNLEVVRALAQAQVHHLWMDQR
jgi:hypothetical protein